MGRRLWRSTPPDWAEFMFQDTTHRERGSLCTTIQGRDLETKNSIIEMSK